MKRFALQILDLAVFVVVASTLGLIIWLILALADRFQ